MARGGRLGRRGEGLLDLLRQPGLREHPVAFAIGAAVLFLQVAAGGEEQQSRGHGAFVPGRGNRLPVYKRSRIKPLKIHRTILPARNAPRPYVGFPSSVTSSVSLPGPFGSMLPSISATSTGSGSSSR